MTQRFGQTRFVRGLFALAACVLVVGGAARAQDEIEPATQPTTQAATQSATTRANGRPTTGRVLVPVGPIDKQSVNDVELSRGLAAGARRLFNAKQLALPTDPAADKTKVALTPTGGSAMTAEAIYRDRAASVVVVGTVSQRPDLRVNGASGFVISADGVVVTNYHVVGVPKPGVVGYVVMTRDGKVYPVKAVLAKSEKYDVAIIKIDATGLKPVAIADRIGVGADVFLIAHPATKFWYFTRGIVDRYAIQMRKTDPVDTLQISAEFARGSSGAPILSAAGEVVGMVTSTNSIYYETTPDGVQKNLQMVMKSCVTSAQILELIER